MSDRLFVFAKITPKPEYYEDAKQAITAILSKTRDEAGCSTFRLNEDVEGDHLYLYEEWESQKALDIHYSQPYVARVFESYHTWLTRPVEISKMRRVA